MLNIEAGTRTVMRLVDRTEDSLLDHNRCRMFAFLISCEGGGCGGGTTR